MVTPNPDLINELLTKALTYLQQNGQELVNKVKPLATEYAAKAKEVAKPMIEDFMKTIKDSISNPRLLNNRVRVVVNDTTSVEDIVKTAQKYMVDGSDGVAALISVSLEGYVIYLTYLKGREMIPYDDNCYVLIKRNALTDDA